MKIEKNKKEAFKPFKIVIETEKELDFLIGIFSEDEDRRKREAEDFSSSLDGDFFNLLYDYKETMND